MQEIDKIIDRVRPEQYAAMRDRIEEPGFFQSLRLKDVVPFLESEVPDLPNEIDPRSWDLDNSGLGYRNAPGQAGIYFGQKLAEKLNAEFVSAHYSYCLKSMEMRTHWDANGQNRFVALIYITTGASDPLILTESDQKLAATRGMMTGLEANVIHRVDTMSDNRLLLRMDFR